MRKAFLPGMALLAAAVLTLAAGQKMQIEGFENEIFGIRDIDPGAMTMGANTLSARITNRADAPRIFAVDIRTEGLGFGMYNWQKATYFLMAPRESRSVAIGYEIASPLMRRIILRAGESDRFVDIDEWLASDESERRKNPLPDTKYFWRKDIFVQPAPEHARSVGDLVAAHDVVLQPAPPEARERLKSRLPGLMKQARAGENPLRTRLSKLFRMDRECPPGYDVREEGWGERYAHFNGILENLNMRADVFSISGEEGNRISAFLATRKGDGPGKKPLIILLSGNPPGTKASLVGPAIFFAALGFHVAGIDRRPATRVLDSKEKFLNTWTDPVFDAHRLIDYLLSQKRYEISDIGVYGFSAGAGEGKFLAALDERVKAVVLACGISSHNAIFSNGAWVPTFSGMIIFPELGLGSPAVGRLTDREFWENMDKVKPEHHARARKIFNDVFPFFEDLDSLRVVPLIAPAPLLLVSGTEDDQFSIPGVVEVDLEAAKEYRKCDALPGFEFYPEPRTGHFVSVKAGYIIGAFFKRWLDSR